MSKPRSLIAAYILDRDGGGSKAGWDEINNWSAEQGVLWAHLDFTVAKTKTWLSKHSGLDHLVIKSMLADESRPRTIITAKGMLVILRGVNLNPGQDPEDMVSIRIWIDENRIISTRRRKLLSIQDMQSSIEFSRGPKSPTEFLYMFNDYILNRISNVVGNIEDEVDTLTESISSERSHQLRTKIADLRCQIISIRRYLSPQREVINRLYLEKNPLISENDKAHFREESDRITRYIEDLDSARDRASIAQDEITNILAETMGNRVYILSVVAVLFLPLSFITGLLGINVGGIPGADNQWAFLIVTTSLVVTVLLMLFYFRYKKWV